MKKLKVDAEEIALIMDNQDRPDSQYYLDTETGETLAIPEEIIRALDEGESCEALPAWELELVEPAKEILRDSPRYVEVPVRYGGDAYRLMVDFTRGVKSNTIRSKLESAFHGRGAFRRFKDVLRQHPAVEKEWSDFKAGRDREEVKDWLESIGIKMAER